MPFNPEEATMPPRRRWQLVLALLFAAPALTGLATAQAQMAEAPAGTSALNDQLLYQLLIGEMALNQGDAATAYEWLLDAARRSRDEGLYRRVVDIALQARAGEQALNATRAWRLSHPQSLDALRMQLQVLLLTNRTDALPEPLRALLATVPASERPGLISALPRFLQRTSDPALVARLLETALEPYRQQADTGMAVRLAVGRAWLEARDPERTLALVREAQALDAAAPGVALLALELMRERPQAEALVLDYLGRADAEPALRMAYIRVLTTLQRYADAAAQLEAATRLQPEVAAPYLSLGAIQLELKHAKEGEAALLRYLELAQQQPATPAAAPHPGMDDDDDENPRADSGQVQAWLMLAQAAQDRGDFKGAEAWLSKVEDPQRALEVQSRRAAILARQGKLAQARALIQAVPEKRADDARAKLVAEAAVLRDVKRWRDAYDVLASASQRFIDDADLIYEQAMMAEKLEKLDDMEKLLRRVIAIKPDNAHAHNALGYSLADHQQRLPEARELVKRALELAPGDPFITDSMGWIEFRLGNTAESLRLLRLAYKARPDTEIAAHLGEVLWSADEREEARRIWREASGRDAANDVLRETLARLHVEL
jgi:tetratricopeptide (TPR) repeat protein